MLPSWFTRLKDVKAESKHKEQRKLFALSPSTHRHDGDPASFAKSWSLQRANSKAKNVHIEADNTSAGDDSRPSTSGILMPFEGAPSACNLQALEPGKDAMDTVLMQHCANFDPWDRDFISMSNCKRASKLLCSKEIKALAQKGHGVSDNDTEDFTLTSETRSSFCSETSSADSSVSCKSGCEEKGNQDEQNWQERDDFIKSSGIVRENLQNNCVAGEQNVSHNAEIPAEMMSAYCQKSAQIQQDIWRGRGKSYLMAGRCSSGVDSNAESRSMFYECNAVRDSLKTSEACSLVENHSSLKTSPKSSEWEKQNFVSTENLPNIEPNRSNVETLGKSLEKSNGTVRANLKLVFDHSVNPFDQNVRPEERNEPYSIAQSANGCAQPESAEESKRRSFSMRRRRQRGASISAVLPPDLQGVVGDSLALVKMSDNPYEDFRQSIHEMIMEKDLEGSTDVEELLYCYLTLNAPEHHQLIKEVFSDVWSALLMTLR